MSEATTPAPSAETPPAGDVDSLEGNPSAERVQAILDRIGSPEEAKATLDEIKAQKFIVDAYLDGNAVVKMMMDELHKRAFVDTSQQAEQIREALAPVELRSGVPDADLAHLPEGLGPPKSSAAYELPRSAVGQIGFEGVQEVQSWLHAAGLPKGMGAALAERAFAIEPPANEAAAMLAERSCDLRLIEVFGDRYELAWDSFEKLLGVLESAHPGLSSAIDKAGYTLDPTFMMYAMQHALNVYGRR